MDSLFARLDELDAEELAVIERMAEEPAQWPEVHRPTLPALRAAIEAHRQRHGRMTLDEVRRRIGAT